MLHTVRSLDFWCAYSYSKPSVRSNTLSLQLSLSKYCCERPYRALNPGRYVTIALSLLLLKALLSGTRTSLEMNDSIVAGTQSELFAYLHGGGCCESRIRRGEIQPHVRKKGPRTILQSLIRQILSLVQLAAGRSFPQLFWWGLSI